MKKKIQAYCVAVGLTLLACGAGAAFAAPPAAQAKPWPAKVFAPYAFIPVNFINITDCLAETGQKYYTLAFIISDPEGEPAWNGDRGQRMDSGYYAEQIAAVRAKGGDVLISFGGAGGSELAMKTDTPAALQAKYQKVIDAYHARWLDFDIEGKTLGQMDVNARRNQALKGLQEKNPGLRISFTLPVIPAGLGEDSLAMLKDARERGVKVESVNIMTMDYGEHLSKGKKMGDLAMEAAKATYKQTQAIDPAVWVGITPMLGVNDVHSEIFTVEDARVVMAFAQKTPWVRSVAFWASNRDRGKPKETGKGKGKAARKSGSSNWNSGIEQETWAFTKVFKPLSEGRGRGAVSKKP